MTTVASQSSVGFDTKVQFGTTRITYCLRDGAGAAQLGRRLRQMDPDRVVLVVDAALHRRAEVEQLRHELAEAAPAGCRLLSVRASEQTKTMQSVTKLLVDMAAAGATRSTVMVVVGGGLVSNVAGLAAALLFRGAIRVVEVPTTLLAMSDSVLSLKRAVSIATDAVAAKNIVGQFYPSVLIWADLAWLRGLPPVQIRSGLCELVKSTLAIRPDHYHEVAGLLNPDATYAAAAYQRVIELGIQAKTQVMAEDPREETTGLVLEYGHTVGHALELATHGRVPHGQAVGIGMHAAALLAHRLGLLAHREVDAHVELLTRNGVPTRLPASVTPEELMGVISHDNKRGHLRGETHEPSLPPWCPMVLLEGLGSPSYGPEGRPLTLVGQPDLRAVLRDLAV